MASKEKEQSLSPPSCSRSPLSVISGAGLPKMRSSSTRDIVAQVARDAVVESLRAEVAAARREGLFASTELVEVREACRAEGLRYEQEKLRISSRLKTQKFTLDKVTNLEAQARKSLLVETQEKERLELRLVGEDKRHEEQRTRDAGGARAQLGKLQQRCKEAEKAQADLQQNCAREFDAIEAVEAFSAERQQVLELQEHKLAQLTLNCDSSQVALEASRCEAAALRECLASAEEMSHRTVQEHLKCRGDLTHVQRDLETRVCQATERAEEEGQRCAELRFELLHALHHELPSERNRVTELEARERAEAERIRGVCEAEVSDLPPNLIEKVQSAIRRHEAWWSQWSNDRSMPPGSPKKDSGSSRNNLLSAAPGVLESATTRYEAVLGALAQCAGASARENMELRARMAGTWNADEELPPEIQKQFKELKRDIAKVREENNELKVQRHLQDDTLARLKKDAQAGEAVKDAQLVQKTRRQAPGAPMLFHTDHRRQVRLFEAEVLGANREAEAARKELQEQESSHTEVVSSLQQHVSDLRLRGRDADTRDKLAESHNRVLQLEEQLCKQDRLMRLKEEIKQQEASQEMAPLQPQPTPSTDSTVTASQHVAVQRRLGALQQNLADLSEGGTAGVEAELLQLCERLNEQALTSRRERLAYAEKCRSKEFAALELEHRCAELESAVRSRDTAMQEMQARLAAPQASRESFHLGDSSSCPKGAPEAAEEAVEISESAVKGRKKRVSGGRSQLEQRRIVPLERGGGAELSAASTSSGSLPADANGASEQRPVATLLHRWVKGAIDRSDQSPTGSSAPSSPARSSSAPPSTAERQPAVAHLLNRWVTKALENGEDAERASGSRGTTPEKKEEVQKQRRNSAPVKMNSEPVKMLLSRWVKKAVESQDEDSSPDRGASTSKSPPTEHGSPNQLSLILGGSPSQARPDSPGTASPSQLESSSPSQPSGPALRQGTGEATTATRFRAPSEPQQPSLASETSGTQGWEELAQMPSLQKMSPAPPLALKKLSSEEAAPSTASKVPAVRLGSPPPDAEGASLTPRSPPRSFRGIRGVSFSAGSPRAAVANPMPIVSPRLSRLKEAGRVERPQSPPLPSQSPRSPPAPAQLPSPSHRGGGTFFPAATVSPRPELISGDTSGNALQSGTASSASSSPAACSKAPGRCDISQVASAESQFFSPQTASSAPEATASAPADGQSSDWRGHDADDAHGMMQWLSEVDQALPGLPPGGPMSIAMSGPSKMQRLPSVAEEPSGNSPAGLGPEEEADLEEVFQQAEALCDSQHYDEALPIFHELLTALKDARTPNMRSLEAEVRAHLGVTLQSLGRVEDAIEAYSTAVQRDPSLHVCHANLAQLYSYLEDPVRARMHLNAALRLDASNQMYTQLDEQFRSGETTGTLRM